MPTATRVRVRDGYSGYSGYSGMSGLSVTPLIFGHTWSLLGKFTVESTYNSNLPPIHVLVRPGKTVILKSMRGIISAGTSAVIHLYIDDIYINWGITVNTSGVTYDPNDYTLTNGTVNDLYYKIKPSVVSATNDTENLSLTLFIEYNA